MQGGQCPLNFRISGNRDTPSFAKDFTDAIELRAGIGRLISQPLKFVVKVSAHRQGLSFNGGTNAASGCFLPDRDQQPLIDHEIGADELLRIPDNGGRGRLRKATLARGPIFDQAVLQARRDPLIADPAAD